MGGLIMSKDINEVYNIFKEICDAKADYDQIKNIIKDLDIETLKRIICMFVCQVEFKDIEIQYSRKYHEDVYDCFARLHGIINKSFL